jgi:hypothetical protein
MEIWEMNIIPMPREMKTRSGTCVLDEKTTIILDQNNQLIPLAGPLLLADTIARTIFCRPVLTRSTNTGENMIFLTLAGSADAQSYTIEINNFGLIITGDGLPGLFYGIQTLRQMVTEYGAELPCCTITDTPDFPARGFYHDTTRGKVPKLETLFELADKMAYYKLNHLELYVEHTFAFAELSDIWAGSDPLTAEEILRLDDYCKKLYIDLVPSLSTFGHCYHLLRSKRLEHLNELDIKASELPFYFDDRMAHYTLNCSDADSFKLVEMMIAKFSPLFSSKYFNICCDETFDLGTGKNAAKAKKLGKGRLYLDFLEKIVGAVKKQHKIPMLWGDIVLHEPGLISEFPKGSIALNWDYSTECKYRPCELFAKNKIPFYVCPGVQGWNSFLNNINNACENIWNFAKEGRKNGAIGFLNTDWGDYGHVNLLFNSMHGMIYGAAASWNIDAAKDTAAFDKAFSLQELGLDSGGAVEIAKAIPAARTVDWGHLVRWYESVRRGESEAEAINKIANPVDCGKLSASIKKLEKLIPTLTLKLNAAKTAPLNVRELITGARGELLMHRIAQSVCCKDEAAARKTADEIRLFEKDFSEVWHCRNKPSEYYRIKETLLGMAVILDTIRQRSPKIK